MAKKEYNFNGIDAIDRKHDLIDALAKNSEQSSTLGQDISDFGRGIGQGATFGFSDEIAGAIQAGVGKLQGEEGDLAELYRRYQQAQEAKELEAQERSPWLYGAGELAGGVATSIGTGGLGTTGLVAKGATKLGMEASKQGLKEILKAGGKKALAKEIAKRSAIGAAEGIVPGATYNVGKVSGELTEEEKAKGETKASKLLEEAGEGALTGGTLGGLVSVGASLGSVGLSKAKDKLVDSLSSAKENYPQLRQMLRAGREHYEGNMDIFKQPGREDIAKQATDFSDELTDSFMQGRKILGKEITNTLNKAENQGVKLSIPDDVVEYASLLEDKINNGLIFSPPKDLAKLKQIFSKIKAVDEGPSSISPLQYAELDRYISNLKTKIDDIPTQEIIKKLKGEMDTAADSLIPGYSKAKQNYAEFSSYGPEGLVKGTAREAQEAGYTIKNAKNPQGDVRGAIEDRLIQSTKLGSKGTEISNKLKTYFKQFNEMNDRLMENGAPNILKEMGYDTIEDFQKKIRSVADLDALRKAFEAKAPQGAIGSIGSFLAKMFTFGSAETGGGALVATAARAGKIARSAKNIAKTPTEISKKFYNASKPTLDMIADEMMTTPGIEHLGRAFKEALESGDSVKRNSIMFALMQRKEGRDLLYKRLGEEEQE